MKKLSKLPENLIKKWFAFDFQQGTSKQRRPPSLPPSSTDYDSLHLCLADCGDGGPGSRVSYLNFSISKTKLFHSRGSGGAIHVNIPPENEKCLGNLGSKFLYAADQQLNDDTEVQNIIVYDTDTAGMSVPLRSQKPHENENISMLSRKASPLVVSVHDTVSSGSSQQPPQYSLYVLAGPPLNTVPDPAFEKLSYDRETSRWTTTRLPSPPFLDPSCKYFQDPEWCAHIVIKHEIHVSTSSTSFTFDTIAGDWKKCTLFEDARPWMEDIHYPPPYEWMNYPADNKGADKLPTDNIDNKMDIQPADNKNNRGLQSCGGGAPFNFDGGAVLCRVNDDDLLIGIVLSQGVLVVQKLVNNKVEVVHIEGLRDLKIPIHAISASLADFGEGLLCLVVSCFDHNQSQKNSKSEIFITPFQVWRNNTDKKLKCKIRKKFFLSSMKQSSPYQIWRAISCFVPKNSMLSTPKESIKSVIQPSRVQPNRFRLIF